MSYIKQAVILAGLGTRLRPLTDTIPKPMVSVNGKPFLAYLVELLKENGIEEIVLLLGYMPEKITEYFGNGSRFGIKIKYFVTDVSDETGTRIRKAKDLLRDEFLLMYSDNYWPLNLDKLYSFHKEKAFSATVTVYSNKDNFTRNNVKVKEGIVEKYDPSRSLPELNGVDIGFFILEKEILKMMPEINFSFEKTMFAKLVEEKKVAGFLTNHKYYSIGNLERLPATEEYLKPKKIVFLDRDGVINVKPPKADYVKTWDEFKFLPGAVEGMKHLMGKGYTIFIVSNQAGIGRGLMSEADLTGIHNNLNTELKKNTIALSGIYYCLHHWEENCECRKPKPGMFFRAATEHSIDLTKCVFIGDDERDAEAGDAAWIKTILARPDFGLLEISKELP